MRLASWGLALVGVTQIAARQAAPRVGPSLFAVLSDPAFFTRPPAALSVLPSDVRSRVEARIEMRRTYHSVIRIPSGLRDGPERSIWQGRQQLEAFLVTLTNPGAAKEAVEFARSARMFYEWEGYADPPLEEAAFAETYLREHPNTPLAPALNLLLLHKYRCAFEAAVFERDMGPGVGNGSRESWDKLQDQLKEQSAAGYRRVWDRLRSSTDLVIKAVAEDLDQQAYLYQNAGDQHPRRSK